MTVDNKSWRKKLSHWEGNGRGKRREGEAELPVKSQTTHWGLEEGVEGELDLSFIILFLERGIREMVKIYLT